MFDKIALISPSVHYVPSMEKLAEAVLRGLGYAMMPDIQAAVEIKRRTLMELNPWGRLETLLYWYRWNLPSELLERFSEIVLTHGRRILSKDIKVPPDRINNTLREFLYG